MLFQALEQHGSINGQSNQFIPRKKEPNKRGQDEDNYDEKKSQIRDLEASVHVERLRPSVDVQLVKMNNVTLSRNFHSESGIWQLPDSLYFFDSLYFDQIGA